MKRHLSYLKYVLRHKWYVLMACRLVGASLWLGLIHDLSKFSLAEWRPYAETFYTEDGSKQFIKSDAFDAAWKHHQDANPHHWEWWITPGGNPIPMTGSYVREMVADWIGAGLAITGKMEVREWYAKSKDKMTLHPKTRLMVEFLLGGLK